MSAYGTYMQLIAALRMSQRAYATCECCISVQCDERVLHEAAVGFTDIGQGGILPHIQFC